MGCKSATIFSTLIFLVLMFGLVTSDINQDKAECTQKLIALANCLPFVSGEAKSPPIDCCTGVKEVVDKSKRCLCILVKDHDDPNLGFTINVTLALQLPNDCKSPTNLTQCIDILHLPPKSQAAKIFEDFQKTMEKNSTTTPIITPVVPPEREQTQQLRTRAAVAVWERGGWWQRCSVGCYHLF
ncbi:hypothetical protein TSUD_68210 [Trifolium subterraneum]|uniref:Bifunctional inhibitor/plant lipid transfer protein/seed storage helical domain-containing protein n=1 Tax=Trifolium subterraneum TaxID=3900 RepID=A0A2Z6N7I6_TRISU|nr:hypothetical protein TSUD_68210 [Trifolium subterraneum]